MRRSIPGPATFRPTAAMWFNANGHEWGYIGPNGEHLDQQGNPIEVTESVLNSAGRLRRALAIALVLGLLAALIVGILASGGYQTPSPGQTPTTYGPPPT
jgi:hypothetical protein